MKMGAKSSEKTYDSPLDKDPPGFIKRLFYWWMFPLFYKGNRRDLEESDLPRTRHMYDSKRVGDLLERNWFKEEALAKARGSTPSLRRALFKSFAFDYMAGGLNIFAFTAIRTTMPLLFGELLSYWSVDPPITRETAALYAAGMVIGNLVAAFCVHHGNLYCQQFGMKLRVATSSLIFRKVMRLNNGALGETTAGKLVNILSNDMHRFDLAFMFLHYIWIIPIQIAAVAYLGYRQAGYSAIIGLVTMILISLPIITFLSKMIRNVRLSTAKKTDARVKLMSEVISGIQVIKMYAWEIPFQTVVSEKRNDEMKEVKKATIYRTIFIGFLLFTERTALFVTILTLVLTGTTLSATIIYPLHQFLNAAQLNLTLMLPLVMSFTAELLVTLDRVNNFLVLEDRPDLMVDVAPHRRNLFRTSSGEDTEKAVRPLSFQYNSEFVGKQNGRVLNPSENRKFRRSLSQQPEYIVTLQDLSASWTNDSSLMALRNVSMRIRAGKLCAIIGAVGSGKSSILQALLKELPAASGTVSVYGKISYASQEAWLFPSTVRENILFGLPYDPEKYRTVCNVCELKQDFKQFPFGDQTLVGERGVSLSGGQRARINLARAVYREADIYLLDDPLSAVDANVGRKLFETCINGYLRGKTRILVTHQVHFLKAADTIVVLSEGRVENMGTFEELTSSGKVSSSLFASFQEDKEADGENASKRPSVLRNMSTTSEADDIQEFKEQKMVEEEKQSGNIKWEVIKAYFRAGGSVCFLTLTALIIILATAAAASSDYWISYWTNQMARYEEQLNGAPIDSGLDVQIGLFTTAQYLIIYGGLVLACILLTNFRVIPFAHVCVSASKNLHKKMFGVMIKGVMRFFDTSSSGRILNRFTKDMGALDEILPRTLLDVLQIYGNLVSILVLNAIALYWTLIPSVVLLILFGIFVKIYLKTAQGIKRLEGVTKSPVFGMVTSSLNGIATIRSSGAQQRLIDNFDRHQDLHSSAWNSYLAGGCTFGFYLDTLCLVYLATVIYVFLYLDFGALISVGSVGLAVTQSNTLTAMLQHGARMLVEFLAQLTSVERVLEYTRIPTEENLFEGKVPTLTMWPSEGKIEFKDVFLRYAPQEAPVLKNLNFTIESGWKVGIVGRTGAGKSSLISALFRFAFIDGSITIDGVDTSVVARQELRSKISIIPQEPVLFSATIRYNLDPFNIYSDEDLWRALEQVDLKSAIPSLDFNVTEGGGNFSVGQRQLMCLARAVLRSNKVLIMDEATANVDPQTDNFIQQTVRRKFATCTVLTIAHRLNTIMDSDRVIVMSAGEMVEFDHPYNLLSNPDSGLSSMVRETGDRNSSKLYQIAKDTYFQSNLQRAAR